MKDKIKKFYKDHETTIIVAACTAVVTGTVVAMRVAEASTVTAVKASRRKEDGEIAVWVFQKNGMENFFRGMPSEVE